MLCFGRRTLTVLLPVGEARRRSLREVMMRLASSGRKLSLLRIGGTSSSSGSRGLRPLKIAYKSRKSLTKAGKNGIRITIK